MRVILRAARMPFHASRSTLPSLSPWFFREELPSEGNPTPREGINPGGGALIATNQDAVRDSRAGAPLEGVIQTFPLNDVDLDMCNPLIARARMCANRAINPVQCVAILKYNWRLSRNS